MPPLVTALAKRGLSITKLAGKFTLDGSKTDSAACTATFELPAEMNLSQSKLIQVALGNIRSEILLSAGPGQMATLTITQKAGGLVASGYESDG